MGLTKYHAELRRLNEIRMGGSSFGLFVPSSGLLISSICTILIFDPGMATVST